MTLPVIDCLVLSGGGAKGAYGAGAAKALHTYRILKKIDRKLCYIGASAGALNASILAMDDLGSADKLIRIWLSMNNNSVLGHAEHSPKLRVALGWLGKKIRHPLSKAQIPSIYSNEYLQQLIKKHVKFENVTKPLIIAATDYTRGKLKAFCKLDDFDKLIDDDLNSKPADQRLDDWRKLSNQIQMEECLLASASIPVYFPPVYLSGTDLKGNVESGWHIDGGVGNNTPTREAAYFLRRMERLGLASAGDVYCVKLDTPRVIQEDDCEPELIDIFSRTLEIYHRVHTEPVIRAWSLINRDVRKQNTKINEFVEWLRNEHILDNGTLKKLEDELRRRLNPERLDIELIEVEPDYSLGDTITFEPAVIKENIERGYMKMLDVLKHRNKIDHAEYDILIAEPIFSGDK